MQTSLFSSEDNWQQNQINTARQNKISVSRISIIGGAERDRTADPLLAKQVLSQLSYSPNIQATLSH